jgi:ribose-phosphate pyrophosphokinase
MQAIWPKSKAPIILLSCKAGRCFADKVHSYLEKLVEEQGSKYGVTFMKHIPLYETHFANSEVKTEIGERYCEEDSVRGCDVYIIQDVENKIIVPDKPKDSGEIHITNDTNFRALLTTCDAAFRSDASYITTITPSFPFARQHKRKAREGMTLTRISQELESHGVKRAICLDIHNDGTEMAFRSATFESIKSSTVVLPYINNTLDIPNLIIGSIDVNADRAEFAARYLCRPLGITWKVRDYSQPSVVKEVKFLYEGELEGKDVLFVDDMISTGRSFLAIAKELKEKYKLRDIYLYVGLSLLDSDAVENLDKAYNEGYLKKLITTDAIYHPDSITKRGWYEEVSVAELFAEAIFRINTCQSLGSLLTPFNNFNKLN